MVTFEGPMLYQECHCHCSQYTDWTVAHVHWCLGLEWYAYLGVLFPIPLLLEQSLLSQIGQLAPWIGTGDYPCGSNVLGGWTQS